MPLNYRRLRDAQELQERQKFDELIQATHGRLSRAERLCVALTASEPMSMTTFNSKTLTRAEAVRTFSATIKRVDYNQHRSSPLLYFAIPACARRHTGWHVHALLWEFVPHFLLRRHAVESGFGGVTIRRIRDPNEDLWSTLRAVSYVLGQNEPVFGRQEHDRHLPREKSKRAYLLRHRATFEKVNPELLSMIDRAKDPKLPDDALLRGLPLFTNRYGVPLWAPG